MVDLDKDTILVINKISKVLEQTKFEINHFNVGETGAGGVYVELDIRKKKEVPLVEEKTK